MSYPAVQPRPEMSRARSLVIPREHGAWGILLVPLATGAGVGLMSHHRVLPLILFTVAALALFWLRAPVENLLGASLMRVQTSEERRAVLTAIIALGAVATAALAGLFWRGENLGLLAIGAAAALAFAVQAGMKQLGRSTRMTSQVIGSLGLTCTAPAAYYAVSGQLDVRALALWLANWIFAGNQIHFVQVRIRGARATSWSQKIAKARGFFFGQFAMILALVLAWRMGLLPALALLAFVPVLVRGTRWFFRAPQPLDVRRLGRAELNHAIAFGLLLMVGFAA